MQQCTHLFVNATTIDSQGLENMHQALAVNKDRIEWCGAEKDIPAAYKTHAENIHDCQGRMLTPGLIDCHTHLVYAGSRAQEFQMKLQGLSYQELAKRGGGIINTVQQTRKASEQELIDQSLPRIQALAAEGVTTVEIKSGYGLDLDSELKLLRVARKLGELTGLRVQTTFLGAHAIAPEYKSDSQGYVDLLCNQILPEAHAQGLVDAVDVFCESIAFSLAQTEQIFLAAKNLQLPIKCHAEQLSNMGASVLASQFAALSCDHLEHIDDKGIQALAKSNTVAVLLPGAYYFLRETTPPPVVSLRQAKVGMAIATDCNPGSSPTTSLLLMMSMACQFFSMTIAEVWAAVTFQAARALGLEQELGSIQAGMIADLVLWSTKDSAELCYHFAYPNPHRTMIAGNWV